ncbi:hypothetical protein ACYSNO_01385 [Enterococcus sp. LJL98]
MKEALERIHLAEEANTRAYQQLVVDMDELQAEKNKEIHEMQLKQKEIRKEQVTQKEMALLKEEEALQTQLLDEAHLHAKEDEKLYQQHKQTIITQIMNEMRERYGC